MIAPPSVRASVRPSVRFIGASSVALCRGRLSLPSFHSPYILLQEIASMLIAFDRHQDWLSKEVKIR